MTEDCRFEYGYNIFEIHHQKEIISENTNNPRHQKPRGPLMHFRTKIYMYYQQMNDYKLPVYIINVNYQQRHLSFLHFFIFKKYLIVFYIQYNYMLVERLNTSSSIQLTNQLLYV